MRRPGRFRERGQPDPARTGSTEALRQAMPHYRALFDELVEADADQPLRRERLDDVPVADRELGRTT